MKRGNWRGKRRKRTEKRRNKGGQGQEEGEKGAIEEVMMMGTVQIFNINRHIGSNIRTTRRDITLRNPGFQTQILKIVEG